MISLIQKSLMVKESENKKKSTKRSKHEEKQERIDNTIEELKAKHGTTYTDIQNRVWAESFDTRYHQSLDEPPRGSLFKSQGRKSTSTSSSMADPPHGTDLTPQKAANLKSTYIQQIKELHSLQEVGAISSEDFIKQRHTVSSNDKNVTIIYCTCIVHYHKSIMYACMYMYMTFNILVVTLTQCNRRVSYNFDNPVG